MFINSRVNNVINHKGKAFILKSHHDTLKDFYALLLHMYADIGKSFYPVVSGGNKKQLLNFIETIKKEME
jgi:hypothetical protein